MAALLQLTLCGFPPLFPIVLDDIGHERLFDLHLRGPAAIAFEHQLHEAEMILRREFGEAAWIVGLAGEDVVLRDRLERLGGETQRHRVTGLAGKIYGELRKHRIHGLDLSEAPALVRAVAALDERNQNINVPTLDLSGGRHFFKFFAHGDAS